MIDYTMDLIMLDVAEVVRLLVKAYPPLRPKLVEKADAWLSEDGELKLCSVFFVATDLVIDNIKRGDFDGCDKLFTVVERCLVDGPQAIKDAAGPCFLENLINRDTLDARLYVPFMGKESKAFCRAWDDFTGVRTPGLYETE